MDQWINIEVAPDDEEILALNQFELQLKNMPEQVYKVRELITRFEVCHFKYRRHYECIIKSIAALRPVVEVDEIGLRHLRYGYDEWRNDTSGRSRLGHTYVSALSLWLGEDICENLEIPEKEISEMREHINEMLGGKDEKKIKLVHMLIARLLWRSVAQYRSGGELSELEYQIEATDICNYAFPRNLDKVIKGIGKLEPVKEFQGCGTFDSEIKSFLKGEFKNLCTWISKGGQSGEIYLGEKEAMKIWLAACLAKTIKEDLHLSEALPKLVL